MNSTSVSVIMSLQIASVSGGFRLVTAIDHQIAQNLKTRCLHGRVLGVEVSQASQEVPQHFRGIEWTRRIDDGARSPHRSSHRRFMIFLLVSSDTYSPVSSDNSASDANRANLIELHPKATNRVPTTNCHQPN